MQSSPPVAMTRAPGKPGAARPVVRYAAPGADLCGRVDLVFPNVAVCQWVLSLPMPLGPLPAMWQKLPTPPRQLVRCVPAPSSSVEYRASTSACATANATVRPSAPNSLKVTQVSVLKR